MLLVSDLFVPIQSDVCCVILFGMGMVYVCWHVVCILNGSIENSSKRVAENVKIQKAMVFVVFLFFVFVIRSLAYVFGIVSFTHTYYTHTHTNTAAAFHIIFGLNCVFVCVSVVSVVSVCVYASELHKINQM